VIVAKAEKINQMA